MCVIPYCIFYVQIYNFSFFHLYQIMTGYNSVQKQHN